MIRDFVVEATYRQTELPNSNVVDRVVKGECGELCCNVRFGLPEAKNECPKLVSVEHAPDPRKGLRTADLRSYVRVVCADTVEERVALELMKEKG